MQLSYDPLSCLLAQFFTKIVQPFFDRERGLAFKLYISQALEQAQTVEFERLQVSYLVVISLPGR